MKKALFLLTILVLSAPAGALAAQQSIATNHIQFSMEESGNWSLYDIEQGVVWHGEWITPDFMKVSGTDGTCYVLTERGGEMLQLDCRYLTEIREVVY
jgi:hypothetical protein